MKAGREGRPMHGASSHALAAVVLSKGQRIFPACNSQVIPIKLVRTLLVTHPIPLGVPERPRVQSDHAKSSFGQPLQEDSASRAQAHDAIVHHLVIGETLPLRLQALQRPQDLFASPRRRKRAANRLPEYNRIFQCVSFWPPAPCRAVVAGSSTSESESTGASHS